MARSQSVQRINSSRIKAAARSTWRSMPRSVDYPPTW